MMSRRGFTLVEIAFSLLLLAIGILTMALFLPGALRAHQKGRAEIYANAQASSLIEQFAARTQTHDAQYFDAESNYPWDSQVAYRAFAPDLEVRCNAVGASLIGLPKEIAYRLDSDDDQIRKILDSGGQIFYPSPIPSIELNTDLALAVRPATESKRLVFGITGYAQQNALGYIPWQGVPYRTAYPSPPQHTVWRTGGEAILWDGDGDDQQDVDDLTYVMNHQFVDAAGTTNWSGDVKCGFSSLVTGKPDSVGNWLKAKAYFALAWWYARTVGLPDAFVNGTANNIDIQELLPERQSNPVLRDQIRKDLPKYLRAMRILAHAGLTMTKDYSREPKAAILSPNFIPAHPGMNNGIPVPGFDQADDPRIPNRSVPAPLSMKELLILNPILSPLSVDVVPAGFPIPDVGSYPFGFPSPSSTDGNVYVTHDLIVKWHDLSIRLAMAASADSPYNWRFPRPYNRMIMMDHPLVQCDISDNVLPLMGKIAGADVMSLVPATLSQATQWRPIAAGDRDGGVVGGKNGLGNDLNQPTVSSLTVNWSNIKGNIEHFSLTQPFSAAERCREIVAWAVDWQDYEDFETAPSAPIDASRYPRANPENFIDRMYTINGVRSPLITNSKKAWMESILFIDIFQPEYRNPEKRIAFMRPVDVPFISPASRIETGANVRRVVMGPDFNPGFDKNGERHAYSDNEFSGPVVIFESLNNFKTKPDSGLGLPKLPTDSEGSSSGRFVGLYGADRNGNNRLDRGIIPPSVRLRATTVARFLFYDPRLYMSMR